MNTTTVVMSFGTRRGQQAEINQDVIGLNGWALHGDSSGLFPPWAGQELTLAVRDDAPVVMVVADGLGGLAESHTASLVTAEEASRPSVARSESAVVEALNLAHRRLLTLGEERPAAAGVGSTVVGLIVFSNGIVAGFNVGDSRLYFTNVGSLVQGSRDDREQVTFSTRLRLATWIGQAGIDQIKPWVRTFDVVAERRVLLCTDGLYTAVAEQTLQDIVCDPAAGPAEIVRRLLAAAGEANADDITALVAQVNVIDEQQAAAAAPGNPPAQRRWFAMHRGG